MKVGFLGTGHISAPMARGLARAGHQVTVSERNREVSAALAATGLGIAVAENQAVVDASEVVFLCLRPAVWEEVIGGLKFRGDQQIVSVMAGISLAELSRVCAPAARLSIMLPYGFVEQGGCPLPLVGDPEAVTLLFGDANPVLRLRDEAELPAYFAASTLASASLGLLSAGADWLAGRTGDADAAEQYVSRLIAGILSHSGLDRAGRMAEEQAALATPRSLNLQMVDGLRQRGAFDGLDEILDGIEKSMS